MPTQKREANTELTSPPKKVKKVEGRQKDPNVLRWGIVSAGKVSHDFTICLQFLSEMLSKESTTVQDIYEKLNIEGAMPRPIVGCVGARNLQDAENFAKLHKIKQAVGSYDEVFENEEIDVVYIGCIHTQHFPLVSKALDCGKHVVCEKPLGMNFQEVQAMVQKAKAKNLFLLEGMWTRFFPLIKKVKKMVLEDKVLSRADGDAGACDDPPFLHISADFCVLKDEGLATTPSQKKASRYWDRNAGGGVLLNLGCYPLHFACSWLREEAFMELPKIDRIMGKLDKDTGIDVSGTVMFDWGNDISSTATWSMVSKSPEELLISGKRGYVKIHGPAHCPVKASLFKTTSKGLEETVISDPCLKIVDQIEGGPFKFNFPNSEGFVYEIASVCKAIGKGELQCEEFSWQSSLHLSQTMDEIRHEIGLVYPQDHHDNAQDAGALPAQQASFN